MMFSFDYHYIPVNDAVDQYEEFFERLSSILSLHPERIKVLADDYFGAASMF